jgi:transcriptional regulator with XRE-family HTH domain
MPILPETPEETAERNLQQLMEQRRMLRHVPEWIRRNNLRQKDVANALGVSEATVSKWFRGDQRMSVGQLRQIAALLKVHIGDLLQSPDDVRLGQKVEDTLAVMDKLTDEEWERVMHIARAYAASRSS